MKEEISIVWSWKDVREVCPHLDKESCCKILESLEKNHDSSIGINWDVIIQTALELHYG